MPNSPRHKHAFYRGPPGYPFLPPIRNYKMFFLNKLSKSIHQLLFLTGVNMNHTFKKICQQHAEYVLQHIYSVINEIKLIIYKLFIVCNRLLYWWFLEHLVNRNFNQLWVHELNISVNKSWARNFWVLKREIIMICFYCHCCSPEFDEAELTHGHWRYTCYYYLRIIDENKTTGKH